MSRDALSRRTGIWTATGLVLGLVATLAGPPAPAHAQGDSPADTGWVEIGGKSAFGGEDDPFADVPSVDALRAPEGGKLVPYFDFNRVDQFTFGLDHRFTPESGWKPAFNLRVARAFGRRTSPDDHGVWVDELRIEQPLAPGRHVTLGLARFRTTTHPGDDHVGDVENALSALWFKYDWRDWYATDGWQATLQATAGHAWTASARFTDREDFSIVETAAGANSIFRRKQDWRANPPVDEGRLRAATFDAGYDSRNSRAFPRRGLWNRIEVETAGGSLGGDFGYVRWFADLRGYLSPAPSHLAKLRVQLGTTGGGVLPFQETFAIGGIGTLRAAPFAQYRGRHLFLVNGDWAWEVLRRSSRNAAIKTGLAIDAFSDFGLAWDAPAWDLGRRRPAWNAGLGVGTTDETIRVYFARDLRAERSPLHVTVRVARTY